MGDEDSPGVGCLLLHISQKTARRSRGKLKKIIKGMKKSLQEETGEGWDASLCKAGNEGV